MYSTIAVGTDGSPTAGVALQTALDLAERCAARVVLISAFASGGEQRARELLAGAAREARRRGLDCETEVAAGEAGDVIVEVAARRGAELIVVGNKGMHRRLLGSVPDAVTHHAPCSVYVVKTT